MPFGIDDAALALGGASLIGTGISSAMSMSEANKNRNYQRWSTGNAHQREVADLKKAGLNPILSGTGGSGAGTGGGAMGQIGNFGQAADIVNSARQVSNQKDLNSAIIRKTNADASVQEQTAKNLEYQSPFLNQMPYLEQALKQNQVYQSDNLTTKEALAAALKKFLAESSSAQNAAQSSKYGLQEDRMKSRFFETGNATLDAGDKGIINSAKAILEAFIQHSYR